MGKLKSGLAAATLVGIDAAIDSLPDPTLRLQLKSFIYAVKIPYAFLKEVLPTETDKFITETLNLEKIKGEVISSTEFQQALGNTLQNMVYVKEIEKRDIIKKIFKDGYVSQDVYAKNHLEKLQDTAQRISVPALQHLCFFKNEILPLRDREIASKLKTEKPLPGYTEQEYEEFKKRTTPISLSYDPWHESQRREAEAAFNKNSGSNENRINFELSASAEQKRRLKFSEFWTEFGSLGLFRQGNDPSIGTFGGGSGTVQYLTSFGENFIRYISAISNSYLQD